jgi:hypothetical protein
LPVHWRIWLTVLLSAVSPPTDALAERIIDLAETGITVLSGTIPGEQFGYSLASGDLGGNGHKMIIVGAPGRDSDDGDPSAGGVYIFSYVDLAAGNELVDTLPPAGGTELVDTPGSAMVTIVGPAGGSRFGATVAAGDWDGDGSDELVVGAPDDGLPNVVLNGALYLFDIPDGSSALRLSPTDARLVIRGTARGGRLGSSLLTADLDGDGRDELVVSAFRAPGPRGVDSGRVYVLDSAALSTATGEVSIDTLTSVRITGENAEDGVRGLAVADTDGDGVVELLVGAYLADGPGRNRYDVGKLYVVEAAELLAPPESPASDSLSSMESPASDSLDSPESADAGTTGPAATEIVLPDHATVVITGAVPRGFLGRSIAAGDVDLDGNDDVFVSAYGAQGESDKETAAGEAYLIFGGDDTLTGAIDLVDLETDGLTVDDWPRYVARSRWNLFGLPVFMADMNGDGPQDLIVAAQLAGRGSNRKRCGEIYIYFGSLRSVMTAKAGSAEHADVTVVGASALDSIGGALLAADLTGSGHPALIIGAPDVLVERLDGSAGSDGVDKNGGRRTDRCGRVLVVSSELLLDR